jgi:peptidoglycan/LPS O-acetylase OafA/YrhL
MTIKKLLTISISKNRVFGLDILRCFAILFVIIGHGNLLLPEKLARFADYLVLDGVSIFFVLSGFLIGGILIKELEKNQITLRFLLNFWKRRWFRTLPNYFLVLIVLCLIQLIFADDFNLIEAARFVIFSQNFYTVHPEFFSEAWSLSIEEWFYLIIPTTIIAANLVLRLRTKSAVALSIFIIIIATTAFRFYRYAHMSINSLEDWDIYFRKQVITRLDSIIYGVLGAYLAFYAKEIWLRFKKPLFYIGLALLILTKFFPITNFGSVYVCVFYFSVNAFATLLLIPYLSSVHNGSGAAYKMVTYVSLISYSMYLVNFSIVMVWILGSLPSGGFPYIFIVKYCAFWLLTIVLSILLYKYFEVPTMKLRDRKKQQN